MMDILIRIASDSSTGHYPEAVLEDEIYRTKENGRKCAELGIRLSSPKLGGKQVNQEKAERKIAPMDSRKWNADESKFC